MSKELTTPVPVTATVTAITPIPVGTVITYSGNDVPNGWLACDGSPINSNDYPRLAALVGDHVPDLRSRFIVGAGQGSGLSNYVRGTAGGEETHTLSVSEIPPHKHNLFMGGGFRVRNQGDDHYVMSPSEGAFLTDDTGGGLAHENRPPYYVLVYLIKY